ncbi:pyridoxal phosphate-dependent aminotransferase [Phyllobacterium zundukense]|uniref:histidinol-phosphate transaminase n=1 Tax=Phyllobacterium zundukense TaxID=1867719 RepID=A0A2N9VST5_9HYPH|nr:pyridoxal phosphate-dependent aminotransferase [Phyllobacterium zundukense]ATU93812.1 histidinol-phosphate aminotransferase [Phyllobacterium zundukense]PIO42553.1 histidinol-phosphate aminotransferase [Phyllobacterium zundukense]
MEPQFTPLIDSLPSTVPFVGPEALERKRNRPFRARLGANENGFGPAPSVIAAMQENAAEAWKYADPENFDLKRALAVHLGVAPGNVVVGEGVDMLLGLAVRQYVREGTPVVTSLGAYPTFNFHVAGFGGRLATVPYRDDREDLDGLLAAVKREQAPLVYFSNPDNPMGTWWEAAEIERFINALPKETMLVLDEAYGETAPATALPPVDISRPNVLRMRTFSKAYGLAGMRCGYAIGAEKQIGAFDKIRNHFGMNKLTQIAALAALKDQPYLKNVIARIIAGRERIAQIAAQNGLQAIASATNFVTIDCGRDGPYALAVLNALIDRDVFVRKPMAPVLDRCIRVSVGLDEELDYFAQQLPEALAAVK